jgi:cytochrome c556
MDLPSGASHPLCRVSRPSASGFFRAGSARGFASRRQRLRLRAGNDAEAGMRLLGRGGVALAMVTLTAIAAWAATPDELVAQRRAGYKHMGDVFKSMKDAVQSGAEVTQFAAGAGEIVDWSKQIPTLFPPGTETAGGTHALPAIWSDRPGFDKLAGALTTEATKLQKAAASGDKAAFAAQFKATGAVCGECHHTYRAKL